MRDGDQRTLQCGMLSSLLRSKVEEKQSIRRDFYSYFKAYKEPEYAEEFLSLFLQYFVKAVHHEKLISLTRWLKEYKHTPSECLQSEYNIYLLDMMWSSLPLNLVANFVKSGFRSNLDSYVAQYVNPFLSDKKVTKLEDVGFLRFMAPEPDTKNTDPIKIAAPTTS